MNGSEWLNRSEGISEFGAEPGLPLFEAGSWVDFDGHTWQSTGDSYSYLNAGTCPDCGYGMVRLGHCMTCPSCGYGSCGE